MAIIFFFEEKTYSWVTERLQAFKFEFEFELKLQTEVRSYSLFVS